MSRPSIFILIGVVAMFVPFSGLPDSVRTVLIVIIGAVVFGFGLADRLRAQRASASSAAPEPAAAPAPSVPAIPEPPKGVSAI